MRGPPIPSIAFADQIFVGAEAAVFHQPVVNDSREVMNVVFSGIKLLLALGRIHQRAAIAGMPIGSMNTMSVAESSHVPGLSINFEGSDGLSPCSPNAMCLGPMAPKFRNTDAAPGPPFSANVTGRS